LADLPQIREADFSWPFCGVSAMVFTILTGLVLVVPIILIAHASDAFVQGLNQLQERGIAVPVWLECALLVKGSLFNIAHFQKCVRQPVEIRNALLFPNISSQQPILKKGPRGFRRRSKSGRKRPGEGSDSGGAIAYRHSAN
jgi:hypothetical protein